VAVLDQQVQQAVQQRQIGTRPELEEEVGMSADVLARLTTIYTTPGFTDERIHLFLAHELKKGSHRREKDEFMEVETRKWSEVMKMVREGQVAAAGLAGTPPKEIPLLAETVCIHGDGSHAVEFAQMIHQKLSDQGIAVRAPTPSLF